MISYEELVSKYSYDPETGIFKKRLTSKRDRRGPNRQNAGSLSHYGYWVLHINKKKYFAHRLAWLYVHGAWPVDFIDHINGIRDDNRIVNLRPATKAENCWNSKSKKITLKGAYPKGGKWYSTITKHGKPIYLGTFDTREEAHLAYYKKALELFGEFAAK